MRPRRRDIEIFSLSFLDVICCGFGAIILLFVLSKFAEPVIIEEVRADLQAEIVRLGMEKGVDYAATVSCYAADERGRACGVCDSCRLRRKGFEEAGVTDPTHYQA